MSAAGDYGMREESFKRLSLFYAAIQVAIWVKVAVFFFLTGKGATIAYAMSLSDYFNPAAIKAKLDAMLFSSLILFDGIFHQLAHLLIGVCAFALAKNSSKLDAAKLLPLFLVASLLHNLGYWFTGIFPTPAEAAIDFAQDVALLYLFTYAFAALCSAVPQAKTISIPFLDGR